MSQVPPPGEGNPFDLPIQTAPDWLLAAATRGKEREPWYYGFLEKYARVFLWYGVVTFGLFAAAVLFPLFFPKPAALFFHHAVTRLFPDLMTPLGPGPVADDFAWIVGRVLIGLVVLGAAFLAFLLPILLTVAYILLSVDAGRNLRAIRYRGQGRG